MTVVQHLVELSVAMNMEYLSATDRVHVQSHVDPSVKGQNPMDHVTPTNLSLH